MIIAVMNTTLVKPEKKISLYGTVKPTTVCDAGPALSQLNSKSIGSWPLTGLLEPAKWPAPG